MTKCFKIKPGTKYDLAVKKHFKLLSNWDNVFGKVGELLGETITRMALDTKQLYIDVSELKNEENKRLFTKDGKLKGNIKRLQKLEKHIKR